MRTRWSRELVITRIQRLYRAGRKLDSTTANKRLRTLTWAAGRYFGGWRQAIEAAGIDYWGEISRNAKPHNWSKRAVVAVIRRRHEKGKRLNSNCIQMEEPLLYNASIRYFKGWGSAVEAAGFDYASVRVVRPYRDWDKGSVVRAIQRRHRLGQPLSTNQVMCDDRGLYGAARRHFGRRDPWKKALRAAGIKPSSVLVMPYWTKGIVRRKILELRRARAPLNFYYLFTHGHKGLVSAGKRLYGTWGKAITVCGFNYARIQRKRLWDKDKVRREIRHLHKAGIRLSSKAIQLRPGGLFAAAVDLYGSWCEAVEAAGVSYRDHCSYWTYKSWLRTMHKHDVAKIETRVLKFAKKRRKAGHAKDKLRQGG